MRTAVALLLIFSGIARAEDPPEQLLPATAQLYLRWDGIDAHKDAYRKTALGKMLAGDTGTFINEVFTQVQAGLGTVLTVEELLSGAAPEELRKMKAQAEEAAKLLGLLAQHGFILAVDVRKLEPLDMQVTIIMPNVAKPGPLFGALRLVATLSHGKTHEKKFEGRDVTFLGGDEGISLAWWAEEKHAVVTFATVPAEAVVKRIRRGNHARLTAAPLFKRLQGFDKFETGARGFLDMAALVKVAESRGKEFSQLFDDLGLKGLKSLVLYSGFDGDAERGLIELETTGERKGLLTLLGGKAFRLADLPPIAPDSTSWSAMHFDPGTFYDVIVSGIEGVVRIASPDDVAGVKGFIKLANDALGMDVRKDLLDALGDRFVMYQSPSEGPFSLGQTYLFKVKDADKVKEGLAQLIKGVSRVTGAEVRLKKRTYRGAEVREVHLKLPGFVILPSYAVHKDWLAVSFYPQSVHGYILRANGERPGWKPSDKVKATLEQLPKEFVSIAYSDPRPTLKQLFAIAPLIGATVNSVNPEVHFEVGSLPNAQEATSNLFPNVSVVADDGKVLRVESRASLTLPLDITGIDTYGLLFLFGSYAARF
jgi:hypothetical protein